MNMKLYLLPLLVLMILAVGVQAQSQEYQGTDGYRQIRTVSNLPFFSYSIFSDKDTYIQGEYAIISGYFTLLSDCQTVFHWRDYYIDDIRKENVLIGYVLHPTIGQNFYWEVKFTSTGRFNTGIIGRYKYVNSFSCTYPDFKHKFLNNNGYISGVDFNGDYLPTAPINIASLISETKTFSVVAPPPEPPPPTCTLSCDPGYELMNPDSADCSCRQSWVVGNNVCEIGEPTTSIDCFSCPDPNYKSVDGICIPKTCEDGTLYNDCSASQPNYCVAGNLIPDAPTCGCPDGITANENGTCGMQSDTTMILAGIVIVGGIGYLAWRKFK